MKYCPTIWYHYIDGYFIDWNNVEQVWIGFGF